MAIVPMKRIFVLGRASDAQDMMRYFEKLGLLHPVKLRDAPDSKRMDEMARNIREHSMIMRELTSYKPRDEDLEISFDEAGFLLLKFRHLKERRDALKREIFRQDIWGNFNVEDVSYLSEKGILLQLWQVNGRIPSCDAIIVKKIKRGGTTYFATLSKMHLKLGNAIEISIPAKSLSKLKEELKNVVDELNSVELKLCGVASHLDKFKKLHDDEIKEYDFFRAFEESYADEKLAMISGWIPVNMVPVLEKKLAKFGITTALHVRDPKEDEVVPVLTKNSRLVSLFEPLLKFLGMPDYHSVDPTSLFAPFMFLFFGICLGDIGYGAMMVAFSFLLKKFLGKKHPQAIPLANLMTIFGIATIIWGMIMGSFVGLSLPEPLKKMVLLDVSQETGNPLRLFYLSIALGIIHLTISFMISVVNLKDVQGRLAETGKILVLWGGTIGVMKLKYWWIPFVVGILFVLFLSSPDKNPFKRIGLGLWNVYGLSGLIGDVISYARLFGLGMATGAIAAVVNKLAIMCLKIPYIGILFMIMVLLVGHMYNFIMGIISSTVHPARLHAVEAFPKFTKMTGEDYKPLVRR